MMKSLVVFFLLMSLNINICMGEESVQLGEIVVTPYSTIEEGSIYETPYSSKTYTAKQIEETNASTLLDFLKTESEINVSDWYGTSVKANVDLMGFGDNASSNLLVLVNGRRINDIDMSGIDWTQIPVDTIERVETLKGAGAVLYGDNASGGVINIITKKAKTGDIKTNFSSKIGSYSLNKESISVSGGKEIFNFYAYVEHHSTNGYRTNSHYRSKYANININSQITDSTEITLDTGHHEYVYGLPGALYESDIKANYSRRDSKYPKDNSNMEDNYISLKLKTDPTDNITGMIDINYRNKNGLDELLTWGIITDKSINSLIIKPQIAINTKLLGLQHKIISGIELYTSDLSADLSADSSSNSDIDRKARSAFLQDTINLTEKLFLNLGTRVEKEEFTFDYYSATSTTDDEVNFTEEAYEAGLNYILDKKTNIFMNFSRSFRVPKTDEYLVTWPTASVNKNLLPQTSKTLTGGINSKINKYANLRLDFFLMKTDNEIYYDPLTYSNSNYKEIKRKGLNLGIDYTPIKKLEFSAGYRFVEAEFEKGTYKGKTVPAVPKHKITLSANYDFLKYFQLFIDAQYRDNVYLINDLNNNLAQLDDFWIANLKLSFKKDNFEFFAGINNIFNKEYSEYGSTNSFGTVRALYPSPERNFFGGVKIKF